MNTGQVDPHLATGVADVTVEALFRIRARAHPERIAVEDASGCMTYGELNDRVNRLTHVLAQAGVGRGERIVILSENRREYLEAVLAAACLGAIAACLNFRLSNDELAHCTRLVEPRVAFVSQRFADTWVQLAHDVPRTIYFGEHYEHALSRAANTEITCAVQGEDGLLILYTSGTTGLPKGALISHRAEIVRASIALVDKSMYEDTTTLCWSPFCHIATADFALSAMMLGLKLHLVDGFDAERILDVLAREPVANVSLVPAVIDRMIEALRRSPMRPLDLRACGSGADLVGRQQIADVTSLLNAEYRNTFGATETGLAPLSKGRIPIGVVPQRLSKVKSAFCRIQLVDSDDREVPIGTPGELLFRGPSAFSGYWRAPEVNAVEFRGGWFHMGDVMVANPDGTYDYVDRHKYMIKSGGENIYPAEIERVLTASSRVREAVVVRKRDERWGEVPVAFVVSDDATLTAAEVMRSCDGKLARYKLPKEVHFLTEAEVPRSTTGKVKRFELEQRLTAPDKSK